MSKFLTLLLFSTITLHQISGNLLTSSELSPPENPSIQIRGNDTAIINWAPPLTGHCSGYRVRVFSRANQKLENAIDIPADKFFVIIDNLTAGQTYFFHISTFLSTKESAPYVSKYFTTIPNRPGASSLVFKNETTLCITWLPPSPLGIFSNYSIDLAPPFLPTSTRYLEHKKDNPSPNEITFNNLIPGELYTIMIKTISEDKQSDLRSSNYRTIPIMPINLNINRVLSTPKILHLTWSPPNITSLFNYYEISLLKNKLIRTRIRNKNETWIEFDVKPGETYNLSVKTVSNELSSYPAKINITMEPLPVCDLEISHDVKTDSYKVSWSYDESIVQDSFKLQTEYLDDDGTVMTTVEKIQLIELLNKTEVQTDDLLPGRNYTVTIQTLSNNIESKKKVIQQITEPASPMIDQIFVTNDLTITWKTDVDSRQKFYKVILTRLNDNHVETYTTLESMISIKNIYAGSHYKIQVCASNWGVESEFADDFISVPPAPPKYLHLSKLWSDTSLYLRWNKPVESFFTGFTVAFIGSRDKIWTILPDTNETEIEISDLIQGEKYAVRVNSINYGIESLYPMEIEHIFPPNAVWNVTVLPEAMKIYLMFERPKGKIDYYHVQWRRIVDSNDDDDDDDDDQNFDRGIYNAKNFTATDIYPFTETILIEDLLQAEYYSVTIFSVSHHLGSDSTKLHVKTEEFISKELEYQLPDRENSRGQNCSIYLELLDGVR